MSKIGAATNMSAEAAFTSMLFRGGGGGEVSLATFQCRMHYCDGLLGAVVY